MKRFVLLILIVTLPTTPVFAEEWVQTNLGISGITTLETTPWGILAGELNTNIWLDPPPFNGLYLTKDLGETWEKAGLETKGIKDIAYFDGNLYVASYYSYTNSSPGAYMSKDQGKTWTFLNKAISTTKIAANNKNILLGTANSGLWITSNEGDTWEQKIGNGLDGTRIYALESTNEATIATTLINAYRSTDQDKTWEEIEFLEGKTITTLALHENVALAGTERAPGLFRSTNYGQTWLPVPGWETRIVSSLVYHNNRFYAGTSYPAEVYSSNDFGLTWEKIGTTIQARKTKNLTGILSKHNWIFALADYSIYKNAVIHPTNTFPFLSTPWSTSYQNEALDKTTSFFDHEYPLLGYSYHREPPETKNTTLNYLGFKDAEPNIYYSSHDGYDYALTYGTPITAAAPGYAYYYYCSPCGHTIKINHANGYQTTYMHLQKNQLVTTKGPVWVEKGTQIGLVGMTGNTTGPHLHFAVAKSTNPTGLSNPEERVDPYGWAADFPDPWETYTWSDALGTHTGTKSIYLWDTPLSEKLQYIGNQNQEVQLENKTIKLQDNHSLTINIKPYLKPTPTGVQRNLGYIPNTSVLVKALDHLGTSILNLENPVEIEIDLTDTSLANIVIDTLKIYAYNELSKVWEPLPTVLDLIANKILCTTSHFSKFAVFGEKTDSEPPTTTLTVQGQKENGWFTEPPTITLETTDPQATLFYALDSSWVEYTNPFQTTKDGIFTIEYRSIDAAKNVEATKTCVIKVDTESKFKKRIRIKNANYATTNL